MTIPPTLVRGLSLLGTVALCVGNMVGTSAYTLPASLADTTGPLGLAAWVLTAAGYLLVATIYASLGARYPRTGGPYVFAREAFGDFAGFLVVWSYWVSTVIGNAAIVTSVVGYAVGFSPALGRSVALQFLLAQALVWGFCLLNVTGVRNGARVQIGVMFLNIVPVVLLSLVALAIFDPANLQPFAPNGFGTLGAGMALVVWAYAGVESATVPAEEVQGSHDTIRRGTMIGYWIGTAVFLLIALAVAGALPNDTIAGSARPLALVADRAVGGWAALLIGMTAIVAGLGTLNGWTLMAGRIPLSAARDGLFFRAFGNVHPRFRTPHTGLLLGTAATSTMLLLYFTRTLLGVFNFIVLLAVLTTLLPHLFSMAAEVALVLRHPDRGSRAERRRTTAIASAAFIFVLFTVYSVGLEVLLWGALVLVAGLPLYFILRMRRRMPASGAMPGD